MKRKRRKPSDKRKVLEQQIVKNLKYFDTKQKH